MLLKIQEVTNEILSRHFKPNYLVASTRVLTMSGRNQTTEGIEKKLALNHYSRWKFIHDLALALEKGEKEPF